MAEVHSIFGAKINADGANEDVVNDLTQLLEEAKRGEIIAFAIAFLDGSECANSQVSGSNGRASALGGSIAMMEHRYFHHWRSTTDGTDR